MLPEKCMLMSVTDLENLWNFIVLKISISIQQNYLNATSMELFGDTSVSLPLQLLSG